MEREEPVVELSRLRQGDADAYQDLVGTYGPRLIGAAERLGHSPQEAEDLVQDAFVALVRSVDRLEGRATIFTWLYRVLLNRHADLMRRKSMDRKRPASPGTADAPPDSERFDKIRASMRLLREPEQKVLFLRFFEGLPYDEIARIVEAPLGTVHAHAFHGLRRLRGLLEEDRP